MDNGYRTVRARIIDAAIILAGPIGIIIILAVWG